MRDKTRTAIPQNFGDLTTRAVVMNSRCMLSHSMGLDGAHYPACNASPTPMKRRRGRPSEIDGPPDCSRSANLSGESRHKRRILHESRDCISGTLSESLSVSDLILELRRDLIGTRRAVRAAVAKCKDVLTELSLAFSDEGDLEEWGGERCYSATDTADRDSRN